MRRVFLIGACLLGSTASCAYSKSLSSEAASSLEGKRIRILVLFPGRNIQQTTLTWTGSPRSTLYRYAGIWDPAPLLEPVLIETVSAKLALQAEPLRTALQAADAENLVAQREREILGRRDTTALGQDPDPAYQNVRTADADYLLEIVVAKFIVAGDSPAENTLMMSFYGRLLRMSDGTVFWREKSEYVRIEGVEKFSDLDKDDRALLKTRVAAIARKGLSADSPLFAGLQRPQ